MRIFIAVALDAALHEAVARLRRRLNAAANSFRWVPVGNLHMTLKFLGQVPEPRLAAVGRATREVAGRSRPFTLAWEGLGAFPSPRRAQVVWIGVGRGRDEIAAIARDLDGALNRLDFAPEQRAFRPHLTVARAKHGETARDVSRPLGDMAGVMIGSQTIHALLIMESLLHPTGATYRCVEEMRLGEGSNSTG